MSESVYSVCYFVVCTQVHAAAYTYRSHTCVIYICGIHVCPSEGSLRSLIEFNVICPHLCWWHSGMRSVHAHMTARPCCWCHIMQGQHYELDVIKQTPSQFRQDTNHLLRYVEAASLSRPSVHLYWSRIWDQLTSVIFSRLGCVHWRQLIYE